MNGTLEGCVYGTLEGCVNGNFGGMCEWELWRDGDFGGLRDFYNHHLITILCT